jgi:hypothetical protein
VYTPTLKKVVIAIAHSKTNMHCGYYK